MALRPKQQRFVDEYLVDLNATQAALRAGFPLIPCQAPKAYYVYALIDPTNHEIFYIGKGSRKRYAMHEGEWRAKSFTNPHKTQRIGQIIHAGFRPVAMCLAEGIPEEEAYEMEGAFIHAIGLARLTNTVPGQIPLKEQWQAWACDALQRIKTFEEWMSERQRSEAEQRFYWQWVAEIQAMADGVRETRRVIQVNDHVRAVITYESR